MAKLSQQLKEDQTQPRVTRSQRVQQKQAIERGQREEAKFEREKAAAQELQETEFSDIKTVEEYEVKYKEVDPNLKPFFQTPTEVRDAEQENIAATKTKLQNEFSEADKGFQSEEQRLRDAKKKYQDRVRSIQNSTSKNKSRQLERASERLDDAYDRFEEKAKYYQGYKKGLKEGLEQLNQGKNLSFNSLKGYAQEIGYYEEEKKRARNEQRSYEKQTAKKIEDLEAQGYKPVIVEGFKGSQPKSVELLFQKGSDFQSIAKVQSGSKYDVKGFESIGFSAPQERVFTAGGKDFKFQSRVEIFKDQKGQVLTPYKKTGFTEAQLIKQGQDSAYVEFQEKYPSTATSYKIIPEKDLPLDYGGQQTISNQPRSVLIPEAQYNVQQNKKPLKEITGFFSNLYSKISEGKIYYNPTLIGGGFSFFKKSDRLLDITAAGKTSIENLDKKSSDAIRTAIGGENLDALEDELGTKYQGLYQEEFEKKYGKDLIYDEVTFEEAQKSFEESAEAKDLQIKYQEEYTERYKEISSDVPILRAIKYGGLASYYKLTSLGTKAVTTPKGLVTTGVFAYGGVKTFQGLAKLPSFVSGGLEVGFTGYGGYKFLSPTSTIEERFGGAVMLGLGAGGLVSRSYRYLRSPVIKRVKIPSPKPTLKSTEVIGVDLKKNVLFGTQQTSQTGVAGYRTIVTTKGRVLSANFWKKLGANVKPNYNVLYKGVPTQQLGKTQGFFYQYKTPSAYQKAYGKLLKYDYTPSQARSTLRYSAPRVYTQTLDRGVLTISGNRASGSFEYLTKQPVISIDKNLGIKTRGGRTIKDVYDVERLLVKDKFVLEEKIRSSVFLKRGSSPVGLNIKGVSYENSFISGKGSGLKRAGNIGFQRIDSVSLGRRALPVDNILRIDQGRTILIKQIIEKSKFTGVQKPAKITKTPFSKTFGSESASNKALKDVKNVLKQKQLQTTLRSAPSVQQQVNLPVQDAVAVKQVDALVGTKVRSLVNVGVASISKTDLKTDVLLKDQLKSKLKTDALLKDDLLTKTLTKTALKSAQTPITKLSSKLATQTATPTVTRTPIIRPVTPRIPNLTYTPKPFAFFFPAAKQRKSRKGLKKQVFEKAYLPDFTTRAIGLKPEVINEKEALKKVKKVLTGLEIRRGVVVQ